MNVDVSRPWSNRSTLPILLILDGYWDFALASHAARGLELAGLIEPLIVVGISRSFGSLCPKRADEAARLWRFRDLTPTGGDASWIDDRRAGQPMPDHIICGGADQLLDFIEDELAPYLPELLGVRVADIGLAGFSLSGLATLHAFFSRPDRFRRFLVGSPSLWWDQNIAFEWEIHAAAYRRDFSRQVFLSTGSLEDKPFGVGPSMRDNVQIFADQLKGRRYPSLHVSFELLVGETHVTAVAPTYMRGIRSLYATMSSRADVETDQATARAGQRDEP